jgi:hypothetical protein
MSVSGVMRKPWVFRALHIVSALCAAYAIAHAIVYPETVTKWDVIGANVILIAWNANAYTLRRLTDQLMGALQGATETFAILAERQKNLMGEAPVAVHVDVPKPKGEN